MHCNIMHCNIQCRAGVVLPDRLCPQSLSACGKAYRYAHNELRLYSPASGTGVFTEQYLKDRAAMLSWKLSFGTKDTQPVGDTFVKPQGGTPFYFEDFTSNAITTKMRIGGGDSINAVMGRPLGDFRLVESQAANNSAWRAAA